MNEMEEDDTKEQNTMSLTIYVKGEIVYVAKLSHFPAPAALRLAYFQLFSATTQLPIHRLEMS